jgi:glycosyltransferase involved in cell wall biosynthesis
MKRRLLILSPRFPYPVIGGDRLRIFHVCKGLSQSFDLTLLTFCETKEELRSPIPDPLFARVERVYLPRWKSYLNAARALPTALPLQLAYYRSAEFQAAVERLLPQHDAVVAHLIRTGQYVAGGQKPVILEMTDAISLNYQRMAEVRDVFSWKKFVYGFERSRLLRYEISTLRQFDRVWLVSDVDREFLATGPSPQVEVIPQGVDVRRTPFATRNGDVIAFIGNVASVQNQDACFHFARDIFPKIRQRAKLTFRVIGNISDAVAEKLRAFPGVEVTGRFEDISGAIEGAFCGVCPLRAGAGMQTKNLEYMALGLPCLTSRVGLEGIQATENEHLLVYDSIEEAVNKVLVLHSDPGLRRILAHQGRALVERSYDWNSIHSLFEASILGVLNGGERAVATGTYGHAANGIFLSR